MRKLSFLRGLAILAVVLNHSAGWAVTALVWWSGRFGSATPPNKTWIGTPAYFVLLLASQLPLFSVPLFLFVSGYFVAYASRGDPRRLTYSVTFASLRSLLGPFVFWLTIASLLAGAVSSLGKAHDFTSGLEDGLVSSLIAYYYVPTLVAMLVVSRPLMAMVIRRPILLLAVTLIMQPTVWQELAGWLQVADVNRLDPIYSFLLQYFPGQLLGTIRWSLGFTIYFVLGMLFEHYRLAQHHWCSSYSRLATAATMALGSLSIVDADIQFRAVPTALGLGQWNLPTFLFGLSVIVLLFEGNMGRNQLAGAVELIGVRSYSIYLAQYIVIQYAAKAVYTVAPWMLPESLLMILVLACVGLGTPLILPRLFSMIGMRRYAKYAFGVS